MKKDKLTQKVISTRKRISAKKEKELEEKLKEAIRTLTQEFKPKRIFLIGSLAKNKVHYSSDIDLVVEGLGDDYLRAGGMLLDRLGEDIDLKPYEYLDEDFRKKVLKEGKLIYSSKKK